MQAGLNAGGFTHFALRHHFTPHTSVSLHFDAPWKGIGHGFGLNAADKVHSTARETRAAKESFIFNY